MRFVSASLQHYRNLALVRVRFEGRRTFLLGANGQGKSNFLEALGYVTALRSFRGNELRNLPAIGQEKAGLVLEMEHEKLGDSRVTLTLEAHGREVQWEGGKVTRLGDFLGRFPTVVFSSQDIQFLRGSPSLRRRWLDLTLSAMDGEYLTALQRYTRAVAERNLLLKHGARDVGVLAAFEQEAAIHAVVLHRKREAGIAELAGHFCAAYARLVPTSEVAGLEYCAPTAVESAEAFAQVLADARPRDQALRSTEKGPHRDDIELLLDQRSARQFASEGQQRGLVLALRLAQAAHFRARGGVEPVMLCDDVLGELDPERRARFWRSLDGDPQVIATGTSLPGDDGRWQVLQVREGAISA